MKHRGAWIFLVSLCAVILALVYSLREKQQALESARQPVIKIGTTEEEVQTLETTWTSARGPEKVTTVRITGESASDFLTRHNEIVTAQQDAYPPVG